VDDLLAGQVPDAIRLALPQGLSGGQRDQLLSAALRLDGLTTSTIHGFCQAIIRQYAVEADVDPGAEVMDAAQATAAFDGVFDQWFRRRLTGHADRSEAVIALSRDDPRHVVETLRGLAQLRRDHRHARPAPADLSGRPDLELADAVAEFRAWIGRNPKEPKTFAIAADLETLANFYSGTFESAQSFAKLWALAHPARLSSMRRHTFDLVAPRSKSAWKHLAGKDGERLNAEATGLFERADTAYRTAIGRVSTNLVAILSQELDEVLEDYARFKRAAAVLDFDDLLDRARTMVRSHDQVRQALDARYKHIFVDEFQDTDPVQAEIVFRIAAEDRPTRWQDGVVRPGSLFLVGDPKQAIYQFRGANAGSYGEARAAITNRWPQNVIQITTNFRSRPGILAHVNSSFEGPLSVTGQPGYVPLSAMR
jgi:ATP-dependent exoDNAse (exonuclease V) beta subunit